MVSSTHRIVDTHPMSTTHSMNIGMTWRRGGQEVASLENSSIFESFASLRAELFLSASCLKSFRHVLEEGPAGCAPAAIAPLLPALPTTR